MYHKILYETYKNINDQICKGTNVYPHFDITQKVFNYMTHKVIIPVYNQIWDQINDELIEP